MSNSDLPSLGFSGLRNLRDFGHDVQSLPGAWQASALSSWLGAWQSELQDVRPQCWPQVAVKGIQYRIRLPCYRKVPK